MAETTEAQDTETTEAIDLETEATTEEESTEASAGDDTTEEAEATEQDQEFEVVLESKGSQPDEPAKTQRISGVSKRINKLNARVDSAQQGEERASNELLLANERNRLLQIQLEQRNETQAQPVMPNVDDFDGGVHDPEYVKKFQEYQNVHVQKEINRQVQEATKQTVQSGRQTVQSQQLERKQVKHYEQASKMGMKNYAEAEDKAIEILGTKTVNVIIDNFTEDSHILLGYLGVNTDKAQAIADKILTNPILGVAELGALRSKLKVKPKSKITPNPDTPLAGGSPSGSNDTDKRAEQLLAKATKSGSKTDLNKYLDHQAERRKAKAKAG